MITPPSCLPKAPWVRDERDTNWKGRAGDVAHWEAALPDAEGSAFHFQHFKQQLPGMEVWLSWWISTRHSETDSSALSQFYPSPRTNNWLTLNTQMASCFMALWQWGGSRQNAWSPHGPQVWGGRGKDWRLLVPPPPLPPPLLWFWWSKRAWIARSSKVPCPHHLFLSRPECAYPHLECLKRKRICPTVRKNPLLGVP